MSVDVDINTFIIKFNGLLVENKTNPLFGKEYLYDNLDNVCVEYLKYRGFVIPNKINYDSDITKIDQLIDIFYFNLYKYHPGYIKLYKDRNEDRRSAKSFIKSRQTASGTSRKEALNECAFIIDKFFEYENEIGFSGTISLSIFSVIKLKWILDKVLSIANEKMKEKKEKDLETKINKITKDNKHENIGIGNLDTILNNIIGEKNG